MARESFNKKLFSAAEAGDLRALRACIRRGMNVNQYNDRGEKPLHVAVEEGKLDAVMVLVESGADLNTETLHEWNETPTHVASRVGHAHCLKFLLDAGADVERIDGVGVTPLQRTVMNGHAECIPILLAFGASADYGNEHSDSALHLACEEKNADCLKALLSHPCNLNVKGRGSMTPLLVAIGRECQSCVSILLEAGADPMIGGGIYDDALEMATDWGRIRVLDAFIGCFGDGKEKPFDGLDLLSYAKRKDFRYIVSSIERRSLREARSSLDADNKGDSIGL